MIAFRFPGDRHIAHMALFLAAQSTHESRIRNLPPSRDVEITLRVLEQLGLPVERRRDEVIFRSRTHAVIREPREVIHLSDAVPTATLALGFLASHPSTVLLSASGGLQERDFRDLVHTLRLMGAMIIGRDRNRRFPMAVQGGGLQGMVVEQIYPDAYMKGAVILAALRALGETRIAERVRAWDHMERLLLRAGVSFDMRGNGLTLQGETLPGLDLTLPGDFSLTVPFLTAGLLLEQPVRVEGIHLNLTRTGFLRILKRMGATVRIELFPEEGPEAVGAVEVEPSELTGVTVREREALLLPEELVFVLLLATRARGLTVVEGLPSMSFPDLMRLLRAAQMLQGRGVQISQSAYRLVIQGPATLKTGPLRAHGDPVLSMFSSLLRLLEGGEPEDVQARKKVLDRYPEFFTNLRRFQKGG